MAEQFKDALERFIAVTGVKGGALQEKYDHLQSEYEESEVRATDVHRRVARVWQAPIRASIRFNP